MPDQEIEMTTNKITDNTYLYLVQSPETELNNLIEKYKNINCELGEISFYEHQIKLDKEPIIQNTAYPIPLNLRQKVKEHLSELIKQKII